MEKVLERIEAAQAATKRRVPESNPRPARKRQARATRRAKRRRSAPAAAAHRKGSSNVADMAVPPGGSGRLTTGSEG